MIEMKLIRIILASKRLAGTTCGQPVKVEVPYHDLSPLPPTHLPACLPACVKRLRFKLDTIAAAPLPPLRLPLPPSHSAYQIQASGLRHGRSTRTRWATVLREEPIQGALRTYVCEREAASGRRQPPASSPNFEV